MCLQWHRQAPATYVRDDAANDTIRSLGVAPSYSNELMRTQAAECGSRERAHAFHLAADRKFVFFSNTGKLM